MPEVLDIEQGTAEWHEARAGIVTASRFKDVLAKGQGKMRATYLYQLAGEIVTGRPMDTFTNAHMERGHEQEQEARDLYAFLHDVVPEQVGFIRDGRVGCSPDGLVEDDGVLEIKTKAPHLMAEIIDKDKTPPEFKAQCQGALLVTGRAWTDLALYCPGFPLVVRRLERDEEYLAELDAALAAFLQDLDSAVDRIREFGAAA